MSGPAAKRKVRAGKAASAKTASGSAAASGRAASATGVPAGGTGRRAVGAGARRAASSTAAARVPATGSGAGASAKGTAAARTGAGAGTAIQRCVREELDRYFALLDGEPPSDLYRLVMHQVEASLIGSVLRECNGNRSRAAVWLGISRGTLRGKLAELDLD